MDGQALGELSHDHHACPLPRVLLGTADSLGEVALEGVEEVLLAASVDRLMASKANN